MLFIKAIKMSMSMMHVTQRFAKNELYIQFQKVNVGLFRDYSKSIYQCQALFQWLPYSQMCKITGIYICFLIRPEFFCCPYNRREILLRWCIQIRK